MSEIAMDAVIEKLIEALEQMAFLSVGPAEQAAAPASPLYLSLDFSGPWWGRLGLLTDQGVGAIMASNMLATGPDAPEALLYARDALRELLNIVCGALLHDHASCATQTFAVGIPRLKSITAEQWNHILADGNFIPLDADGLALAIRLKELV
ncbi:MAG: chemotaxis protein CheX [Planctomycetota bacterium]|nr:chemotaxis protein CheX [Planctomycetota bacterium]